MFHSRRHICVRLYEFRRMIHDKPQNINYLTIGIAHSFHQTKQLITQQLPLTGTIMHSLMTIQHQPKNMNINSNVGANNALSIWSTFDSAARLKRGKVCAYSVRAMICFRACICT